MKATSKSIAESINIGYGKEEIFNNILPNVYFQFKLNIKLLKKLTVYKQYEINELQNIEKEYSTKNEFKNIFEDIKNDTIEKIKKNKKFNEFLDSNNIKVSWNQYSFIEI